MRNKGPKNLMILCCILLLACGVLGCSSNSIIAKPKIEFKLKNDGKIIPVYYKNIGQYHLRFKNPDSVASYTVLGKDCYVFVVRGDYCSLIHEARHCQEGDWHGDDSDNSCG